MDGSRSAATFHARIPSGLMRAFRLNGVRQKSSKPQTRTSFFTGVFALDSVPTWCWQILLVQKQQNPSRRKCSALNSRHSMQIKNKSEPKSDPWGAPRLALHNRQWKTSVLARLPTRLPCQTTSGTTVLFTRVRCDCWPYQVGTLLMIHRHVISEVLTKVLLMLTIFRKTNTCMCFYSAHVADVCTIFTTLDFSAFGLVKTWNSLWFFFYFLELAWIDPCSSKCYLFSLKKWSGNIWHFNYKPFHSVQLRVHFVQIQDN